MQIILTCKYWHNTYTPTGISEYLAFVKFDWNLKQIQSIEMILLPSFNIMSNQSLESKLDTLLVEIRNFKYHDNTCRYCVNTYRWGRFAIPTGIMKIPVGIGPSIDISIAGEDTPR